MSRDRVVEVVRLTNALKPDAIAIVGDLIDGFVDQLDVETEPLRLLHSRYGTFFATGNHEFYWSPVEEIYARLRALNITVLHNAAEVVRNNSDALCLAGELMTIPLDRLIT